VKVHEFVEVTGISHGTVISILHEQSSMKKLSTRCMPRLLTIDHKRDHVISKQCLEMFQRNSNEFLSRFIIVDETSVTSHPKEQSKQWTSPGEPASKKTKTTKSAGKVMATVFWDAHGIIHIDFRRSKRSMAITQSYWTVSTIF